MKNSSLFHITVTITAIIISYMFYPSLLIFSLIGGSVAIVLTLLLEYFIFNKLPVSTFLLLLILVAIFFPKYSGNVDVYAPNNTNLRCKCAGYNSKLWGIDSYSTTCYGIPYSCTTVTPTFEDYVNN